MTDDRRLTFEQELARRTAYGLHPDTKTGARPQTWWHQRNHDLRDVSWTDSSTLLTEHVCELLDEVEAVFAVTGVQTPPWPGRPIDQSPAKKEYSRCLDPGKFAIIQSRIDAWVAVLVERGWARRETNRTTEWRGSYEQSLTTVVLWPTVDRSADGAEPLSFLVYESTDPTATLNVEIAAGEETFVLAELPGCGCDACDSGSAWLLEELDQWTLSVVDGSLIVDPRADWHVQSSFGGHGSGRSSVGDSRSGAEFTAAPWAADWEPLRIPNRDSALFPPSTERGPWAAVGERLHNLIRRLRGQPRSSHGWTIYEPRRRQRRRRW